MADFEKQKDLTEQVLNEKRLAYEAFRSSLEGV
jgi:hypothetical protein